MQFSRPADAGHEHRGYEYRSINLPRTASRDTARAVLTEFAEYGRWELDCHRIYPDGRRTVRVRRRIIRIAKQPATGT